MAAGRALAAAAIFFVVPEKTLAARSGRSTRSGPGIER
jgi:hypothetical protein